MSTKDMGRKNCKTISALSFSSKQRTCTQEFTLGWMDGMLRERGSQFLPQKRSDSELGFF